MHPFPQKPRIKKIIYLDHAATTPTDPQVVQAMAPFWTKNFANPSALYSLGRASHIAVEAARARVAEMLHTQKNCITFTSGGTEANNLALVGVVHALKKSRHEKIHIITTTIEHHSVLEPLRELEKTGVMVTYVPVNERGQIDVKKLLAAIRPETCLISLLYANNEIGTINPIAEIGRELLKYRQKNKTIFPYFHVDACQAAGTMDLHVERLHVDLMTVNGSKIYGPKGSGVLFVRRGVPISPLMQGGGQENKLRSGTENVPAIIGFAKALELVQKKAAKETVRQTKLRNYFWQQMSKKIPDVFLNGPAVDEDRLANNLNVCFKGLEAEAMILYLDAYGIIAATGSACASDSDEASYVLTACGISRTDAKSSVRFTLGKSTDKKAIDYVMKYLPGIVAGIRAMQKV
jgi:cysteine desulfurase